ncbi:hypothetical protein HPB47_010349 [Ixodes persulcatus]|uniref:Uncharacterized protein n=1 Tax=Ixodes persulcatus TaxID=34615 RepID=A0AC60NZC6_IXOPE|nr:hypothetical protein HPB47_010349 [Ixodes persulcatus]
MDSTFLLLLDQRGYGLLSTVREADALRLANAFVTSRVLYSTPNLHLHKFDETALEVLPRKMYNRALDLPTNMSNQRLMGLGKRPALCGEVIGHRPRGVGLPINPKPRLKIQRREVWEAALLDCSDLASQKALVDRARAAAVANGLLY